MGQALPGMPRRAVRPPLLARVRAQLRGWRLAGDLAAGADPGSSDELAVRAASLCSPHSREDLAARLERAVHETERPNPYGVVLAPMDRRAIRDARAELLALAADVRSGGGLDARGRALVHRLLSDGAGPLYTGNGELLLGAIAEARLALRRGRGADG
jgi:hypothetical protein